MLTRHGETVWQAENRYVGRSDVPLTPRGKTQAERLADWAATAEVAATVSSPLSRARETLAPAAQTVGLPPRTDTRLTELDFGIGEGHTPAEMTRLFPEALAAFQRDPVTHHLPGGEDPRHAVARATACLTELAAEFPKRRVLIVWHSTVMRLVLCHLLGIPLSAYRRVFPFVQNSGLTEIRFTHGRCALLEFNTPIEPAPQRVSRQPTHTTEIL